MSSILPATTTAGTAEAKPVRKRDIHIMDDEDVLMAGMKQKMVKRRVERR